MNTLTYWVAVMSGTGCTYQGRRPRTRGRTKAECLFNMERPRGFGIDSYEPPREVTIEYTDAFNLFDNAERYE